MYKKHNQYKITAQLLPQPLDNSKGGDVQEAQPVQDNSTATATATATATTESDNNSIDSKIGTRKKSDDDNNEIPVLLGSLIYDENWFKSTIDDE